MRLIIDNDKRTTTTHPVMPPTNGRLELMELLPYTSSEESSRFRDARRRANDDQALEDMTRIAQRHRFGRAPGAPRLPQSLLVSWIIFLACTTVLGWSFFFYLADQVTSRP